MHNLKEYINEKLIIGNNLDTGYKYFPKTKDDLIEVIQDKIDKEGLGTKDKPLNLNDIDTSMITDMSSLFAGDEQYLMKLSKNGYFDISDWDVSNVITMNAMFYCSNFNGDLSKWDVSNVKNMKLMFTFSKFTGENGDISNWDVSNVENMDSMFRYSKFTSKKGDISKWNTENLKFSAHIFYHCPLENNLPKWYK